MKLGCVGCLVVVVVILVILTVAGALFFFSTNIFGTPTAQQPVSFSKADGYTAQQKLYEVLQREAGRSSRRDPISLTEREANAFLSRHLDEASVPLSPLIVKFEGDQFFAQGQTPLRNLVKAPLFSYLAPYMSDPRLDHPVWVSIRGRISIEGPAGKATRYGTVTVTEFTLGRQPVSSVLLYAMMGPSGAGLFRWPVPGIVDSVEIRGKQAIIRTR